MTDNGARAELPDKALAELRYLVRYGGLHLSAKTQDRLLAAADKIEVTLSEQLDLKAVEFGRALGRVEAERDAWRTIGNLVMAAGGSIEVPDSLVVGDLAQVTISSDPMAGTKTWRVPAAEGSARDGG